MSKSDCIKEAKRIIDSGLTDAKYLQAAPYFFVAGELKEFKDCMEKAGKVTHDISKTISNEKAREIFLGVMGPLSDYVTYVVEEREKGNVVLSKREKAKCRDAIIELAEKTGLGPDAQDDIAIFMVSQAENCLDAIVLYHG